MCFSQALPIDGVAFSFLRRYRLLYLQHITIEVLIRLDKLHVQTDRVALSVYS